MINRLFNFRLFKEGLRQTRLIAFISMVTILAFTGLIWIGILAEQLEYPVPSLFDFYLVGGVLIAQYCITTPLMVLYLFRYLNRRDSSDFYHMLPHTREAISISYFSAIVCWNLITTAAVTALVFLLYGFAPYMTINLPTVLPYLFNMIAAQLLVASAVLLAMSITGTPFANVVVALLIIFVPRLLILVMNNMIEHCCVIVDIAQQYPLLNPCLNVASGLPLSVFLSLSADAPMVDCLTNPLGGVYTLVLALLYAIAAVRLLHLRKSETAGKSSPSRFLQAVYRIAFGVVIGLLPVYMAFDSILWGNIHRTENWMALTAMIMGAALCYFLFELIATKKAKNLLRAIPGLFIFLAIDAVILGASFGVGHAILNFKPQVDDIQFFTISEDEENYFAAKSNSVELEDAASKAIVANALRNTVELVNNQQIHRDGTRFYGTYTAMESHSLQVNFKTDTGWQHRYLVIQPEDYSVLLETLKQHQDYKAVFYDLPSPDNGNALIDVTDYELSNNSDFALTQTQKGHLYQVFSQEVAAMPFEAWYPIAIESHHGYQFSFASLQLTVSENNKEYDLTFPISEDLFPKTTKQYLQYYNKQFDSAVQSVKELLQSMNTPDLEIYEDYHANLTICRPADQYADIPESQQLSVCQQVIENAKPYTAAGSDDIVVVLSAQLYQRNYAVKAVLVAVDPAILEPWLTPMEE